jgi:alcohol dehydrogenase
MKALIYSGVGALEIKELPKPQISKGTDAIVKMTKATICGK